LPARFRRPGEGDGDVGFAIGRLKAGVSLEQAQAEMTALSLQHKEINKTEGWSVDQVPLRDQVSGHIRPALLLLFGAVGAVWLIACVNVANLLLARSMDRQKEFAIRAAIGAGRFRLVRQLLTESLLLSALGGLAGVLLAFWTIPVLMGLSPAHLPRTEEIGIDGRVLSFTSGLSLLAGLLFGLVPAWQAARPELSKAIQGAGASSVGQFRSATDQGNSDQQSVQSRWGATGEGFLPESSVANREFKLLRRDGSSIPERTKLFRSIAERRNLRSAAQ